MKKYLGYFGITFSILGIFLIIIQPFSPAGAVIDISTSEAKISFFVGFALLLFGIGLVSLSNHKK